MEHLLEILDIRCGYGGHTVVDGLTLQLRPGTVACLLGPSGCGKTTVLRAVAGFEPIGAGEIRLDGATVSRPGFGVPPEKRGVGMVFQDYALFPHLSVADNVCFGLRGVPRRERRATAARFLELVGLGGLEDRFPHELSGGQQQRVAVARALAPGPRLLLLDEPFSNLDVELRERLATDIRDILADQGIAALFVTHDQHEAFVMGQRIGVMNGGRILQWDTPFNIYHEPADRFVADFIGQGRFIEGKLVAPDTVETAVGRIPGHAPYPWPMGSRVEVLLRPDDVVIRPGSGLSAVIRERAFKGAETLYTLELPNGEQVLSLAASRTEHRVGQTVEIATEADHLILFARPES